MKIVVDNTGQPALIGRDKLGKSTILTDGQDAEVIDLDARRPHILGWVVCRQCGHHHLAVVDARADGNALECNGCGSMSGELQPDRPADVVPIR